MGGLTHCEAADACTIRSTFQSQNSLCVQQFESNILSEALRVKHNEPKSMNVGFAIYVRPKAFDSKTATRFVRYNLQQLMTEHSNAAEKIAQMESRLESVLASGSQALCKLEPFGLVSNRGP